MTHMYFSARAEGRISYGHLGRTNSCLFTCYCYWVTYFWLMFVSRSGHGRLHNHVDTYWTAIRSQFNWMCGTTDDTMSSCLDERVAWAVHKDVQNAVLDDEMLHHQAVWHVRCRWPINWLSGASQAVNYHLWVVLNSPLIIIINPPIYNAP